MKVQAKQDTQVNCTYVKGPEYDLNGEMLKPGEIIDVPDDFIVARNVFEVVTPPRSGKVRYAKLPKVELPPPEVEEVAWEDDGEPPAKPPAAPPAKQLAGPAAPQKRP